MSDHRCSACGTDLNDINEPCPNCLPQMAWRPPTALGMHRRWETRCQCWECEDARKAGKRGKDGVANSEQNPAYRLAMLALQSERYQTDSEYRRAVDDVLGCCQ